MLMVRDIRTAFLDRIVLPGSAKYVDPGTHLTQQNQEVRWKTAQAHNVKHYIEHVHS